MIVAWAYHVQRQQVSARLGSSRNATIFSLRRAVRPRRTRYARCCSWSRGRRRWT
jgi:hypothetical protein